VGLTSTRFAARCSLDVHAPTHAPLPADELAPAMRSHASPKAVFPPAFDLADPMRVVHTLPFFDGHPSVRVTLASSSCNYVEQPLPIARRRPSRAQSRAPHPALPGGAGMNGAPVARYPRSMPTGLRSANVPRLAAATLGD